MAVQRFKVALNNARFPFISSKAQRAVFTPGLDSAPRTPRQFMGETESIDYNIAQVIYAENAMPTPGGFASVGYRQLIAPSVNEDFNSIFALRDADENTVLYSPAFGKNYIYDETAGMWASELHSAIFAPAVLQPGSDPATARVTYAYVDGKTFVCYSRLVSKVTAITGTYPSATTTALVVNFNSVDYTLGSSPELTAIGDAWTLDISALTYDENVTYTVTATATLTVGGPDVQTQQFRARNDASIMQWDSVTKTLIPANPVITNVPFPVGEIDGISSSNGFLLVWSGISVAWAPFNGTAFDFTIYANGAFTGAGTQIPEDIQGNIRAIISLSGGFLMFTDKNCVAAHYHAQSLVAPWVFREVPGAGGLESYEQATVEGTLGKTYAYTTAGMQVITLNSAESIWPDLSDFVTGRRIERYRFDLQELYTGKVNLDFFVKLTNVANRYIVVSYGTFPGIFSYALVYDIGLARWGKLRKVHRDAFYFAYGAETAALTYAALGDVAYNNPLLTTYDATTGQSNAFVSAMHGLAFLLRTGEVIIANWSEQERDTEDEAVVVIGRVQLSRSRNVQFNRAEVEGITGGTIYVQPSYDGHTLSDAIPLTEIISTPDFKVVGDMIDCKNFNLIVAGTFNLSTLIVEGTTTGSY